MSLKPLSPRTLATVIQEFGRVTTAYRLGVGVEQLPGLTTGATAIDEDALLSLTEWIYNRADNFRDLATDLERQAGIHDEQQEQIA